MKSREIIKIDEDLCDGCGLCVPSCAEGALQIVDGKAKLVKEIYCDGLGACLGDCPTGALTVEVREADGFDEAATNEYLKEIGRDPIPHQPSPVSKAPVLLGIPDHLLSIQKDDARLQNASLLIIADCVPFGYTDEQKRYIGDRLLLLACPKTENASEMEEKLVWLMTNSDIQAIEIAAVENSTCYSLVDTVRRAIDVSGKDVPFSHVAVTSTGEIEEFDEIHLENSFSC